jgi:hypothetical protein
VAKWTKKRDEELAIVPGSPAALKTGVPLAGKSDNKPVNWRAASTETVVLFTEKKG